MAHCAVISSSSVLVVSTLWAAALAQRCCPRSAKPSDKCAIYKLQCLRSRNDVKALTLSTTAVRSVDGTCSMVCSQCSYRSSIVCMHDSTSNFSPETQALHTEQSNKQIHNLSNLPCCLMLALFYKTANPKHFLQAQLWRENISALKKTYETSWFSAKKV